MPSNERQPWPRIFGAVVYKGRRARKDDDGDESEAPQPDQRRALRQGQWSGECVTERVPRKSRECVAAQPFRRGQRHAQSQDAQCATGPKNASQGDAERRIDGEQRRQADHRERQQPAEGRSVDQKGEADPIETGDEITETKTPAGRGRRTHAAPTGDAGTVDQPDQRRESQKQYRPEIERRHRQRRQRAGDECDQTAPPAPGQHDRIEQSLERHGVRCAFVFGRLASSRGAGVGRAGGVFTAAGCSRAAAGRRSLRR